MQMWERRSISIFHLLDLSVQVAQDPSFNLHSPPQSCQLTLHASTNKH